MDTHLFRHARNTVSFEAGQTIFEMGQAAACMYVVQSGQVHVERDGQTIASFGPGEMFGEMALVEDLPRSATARADSDCILVPIDEEHFRFLVQQTPFFALEVMRVMSRRLHKSNEDHYTSG
ncbi:MAG: cyclic nucleotide-binding domain-containing protein [Planctomycetota bacterium]|nr:cyclic nucleotide-binding domain-containing protein [Planctomycetota bacterium]